MLLRYWECLTNQVALELVRYPKNKVAVLKCLKLLLYNIQ